MSVKVLASGLAVATGLVLSVPCLQAAIYAPNWEQDRQVDTGCYGSRVMGFRYSGTYLDLGPGAGEECLKETMTDPSYEFRLEHVWVFQNVPAGQLCVSYNANSISPSDEEPYYMMWRAFAPGDESEAFAYSEVAVGSEYFLSASVPGSTVTCGITTTTQSWDIHVIVSDDPLFSTEGNQDLVRSTVCIDYLKVITCQLSAGSCTGGLAEGG